ncbi:MAG: adenylate/guanylate cyclase domain-containing protein, partial [Verrucomicrobia bacterium]|nr:adenylate/guanylate cyclase domain-containing protein [Verrucomicrobiota bacterium]
MPPEKTEQRKLAAIMFTDMVGYSALSQRNEKLALQLLAEHHRLLRPIFPKFSGREIKTTGDGFLVEFASALEATHCAIEIQRALVQHNASAPAERRIHIRIGVHVGDVVLREADIFGDGVNIAARIEPLAEVGGIRLSGPVYDQVANKMDAPLIKLDTPQLKNIKTPMDVYRVVLPWQEAKAKEKGQKEKTGAQAGRGVPPNRTRWYMPAVIMIVGLNLFLFLKFGLHFGAKNSPANDQPAAATPSTTDQKSIAVLAFVNMSADKDNEYF